MKTYKAMARLLALMCLVMSAAVAAETAPAKGIIDITDDTFSCIRDMTKVRGFFVDNLLGDLDATLAVANSEGGGQYPPGSVVQLVPGEVMVKHQKGFNPATKDWEFFELNVDKTGTKIAKRGFVDVENRFGGNCFACHIKAEPKWDMICETGRGCDPIPLTAEMTAVIQKTDPRCEMTEPLTQEDLALLQQLKQALQDMAAQKASE